MSSVYKQRTDRFTDRILTAQKIRFVPQCWESEGENVVHPEAKDGTSVRDFHFEFCIDFYKLTPLNITQVIVSANEAIRKQDECLWELVDFIMFSASQLNLIFFRHLFRSAAVIILKFISKIPVIHTSASCS